RNQLIRRAILTGTMLTIAIKGDISDLRSGTVHVDGVEPESGALIAKSKPHSEGEPHPEGEPHSGAPHGALAKPGAVNADAHAASERAGADFAIGPNPHSVGAAGKGKMRDFYMCSDICGPIVDKLKAALACLPKDHPEMEVFKAMLADARKAQRSIKAGKLTQEAADAMAQKLSDDIARLSAHTKDFGRLMNTETAVLLAEKKAIMA